MRFTPGREMETKAAIRQRIKRELSQLPQTLFFVGDELDFLLGEGPWDYLLSYLPLPGEPDPLALMKKFHSHGVKILIPKVIDQQTMIFKEVDPFIMDLEPDVLGLPSPRSGVAFTRESFFTQRGLVLVPGLAFDRKGHRLGRGKGFYDRFLQTLPPDTLTLGVASEMQILETLPQDPWDRTVKGLLIPGGPPRLVL